MPEYSANAATSTLNGSITNVATSLTITSYTKFPSACPFRILIVAEGANTSEICTVTAGAGTATWTIVRASETYAGSSSASAHASGATVEQVLTVAGLQSITDLLPLDILPASPSVYDDEFHFAALDAKWTTGFNSVTTTVSNGWLAMYPGTANKHAYFLYQKVTAGCDVTIYAKLASTQPGNATDHRPGIMAADSASLIATINGIGASGNQGYVWIEHANYSETADWGGYSGNWSGGAGQPHEGRVDWFRFRYIASTSVLHIDISTNGVVWYEYASRTSSPLVDRIGVCIENNSGNAVTTEGMIVGWFRAIVGTYITGDAEDTATLNGTYGDEMDQASSLNVAWTLHGTATLDQMNGHAAVLKLPAQGDGLFKSFTDPSADFEIMMRLDGIGSAGGGMIGVAVLNSSGTGVAFSPYNDGNSYVWQVTTYNYASSQNFVASVPVYGAPFWIRIRRVGTAYSGSWKQEGGSWSSWTGGYTPGAFTIAKIGLLRAYTTGGSTVKARLARFNYFTPNSGL